MAILRAVVNLRDAEESKEKEREREREKEKERG